MIETTGLADPAPVAFTFYINQEVQDFYKIDSILTLVDCKHVKEHLDEVKADDAVNEAVSQIAFADRVLLNKTDLVTPEELEEVKATVKSINGFAELIECRNSNVPLDRILGVNSFSIEKTLEVDPAFLEDDELPGATKKKKVSWGVARHPALGYCSWGYPAKLGGPLASPRGLSVHPLGALSSAPRVMRHSYAYTAVILPPSLSPRR